MRRFKRGIDARVMASGLGSYNSFGMVATEAAWRTGDAWLDALLPYLARNRDLFDARIEAAAPGARSMRLPPPISAGSTSPAPACRAEEVAARVKDRARIFVSPGPQFGPGGETWLRFNFATPRPILEEALGRLDEAFRGFARGHRRALSDEETRGRRDRQRASASRTDSTCRASGSGTCARWRRSRARCR